MSIYPKLPIRIVFVIQVPGASTLKLFTVVIVAISLKARVFATAIHFHPSLIFADQARSLPLEWNKDHKGHVYLFVGKARAYPSEAPFRCSTIE